MLVDAASDAYSDGVVIAPGELPRHVRVHEDLLVLAVEPWLLALAQRTDRQAQVAASEGFEDTAALLCEMADSARRVASAGWLEDPTEPWPEIARRASLPEWHVNDTTEAEGYARRLISQDIGRAKRVEWVYGVDKDGGWGLILPPRLSHLLKYVGPYVVGTLSAEEDLLPFFEVVGTAHG